MGEFYRVDIFDTKGIEYLFVIVYLLGLIMFWKVSGKQITMQIQKVLGNLSANILRIPQGLFYNKNHTWAHLEKSGAAMVGMDDFLQHLIGKVEFNGLKQPGHQIKKGEMLAKIDRNGKQLKIFSPISGEILSINSMLYDSPEMLNEDPYEKGWLYKIKPSDWLAETNSYLFAEEAVDWASSELGRFKDFIMLGYMRKFSSDPSMVMLQDGGELRDNILSDLPDEVWKDFQVEFLDFKK